MADQLSAAQLRAILESDPGTGRLAAREVTCAALVKKGLAVRYGRVGDHYLTPRGRRVRDALAAPRPPEAAAARRPGAEDEHPGTFVVDDGQSTRSVTAPGRAVEAAAAWAGLMEIRRVVLDGDTGRPAPWEHERYVHAVALALEAAGRPPSARDADGRRTARGYAVSAAAQDGVAEVAWHEPDGGPAAAADVDELKVCQEVLERAGWQCTLHRDRTGRPFLLASPRRA